MEQVRLDLPGRYATAPQPAQVPTNVEAEIVRIQGELLRQTLQYLPHNQFRHSLVNSSLLVAVMENQLPEEPSVYVPKDPSATQGIDFHGLFRNEWDTWARSSGTLSAKSLRAALPDVVQGLADGRIDPKEFAKCLTWQEMCEARNVLFTPPSESAIFTSMSMDSGTGSYTMGTTYFSLFESAILTSMSMDSGTGSYTMGTASFSLLTLHALGTHQHDATPASQRDSLEIEFGAKFRREFVLELRRTFDIQWKFLHSVHRRIREYLPGFRFTGESEKADFRETNDYVALQYAFDRVCERREESIKSFTGRTVQQNSDLYKATKLHFDKQMDIWFDRLVDKNSLEYKAFLKRTKPVLLKRSSIELAAETVKNGDDAINKMCWECNVIGPNVVKCGGCEAASYCCREHQSRAWKEGHKNSCKLMKEMREFMLTNCKRIERGVKDGDIMDAGHECMLRPSIEIDSRIMMSMSEYYNKYLAGLIGPEMTSILDRLGRPTMDNFYRNIADMVSGRACFVFSDTPDPTLKDDICYCRIANMYAEVEESDRNNFDTSLHRLSFVMGFRPISAEDEVLLMRNLNSICCKSTLFHTAREFVAVYRSFQLESKSQLIRWKEAKTAYLTDASWIFRLQYHKR